MTILNSITIETIGKREIEIVTCLCFLNMSHWLPARVKFTRMLQCPINAYSTVLKVVVLSQVSLKIFIKKRL